MKAQIGRVSVPSVTHVHKASSQVHVEPQYVTQYKLHDDSPCYDDDDEELDTPTDGCDEPALPSDTYYSHIRPSQGNKSMRAQEFAPSSQTRKQKNPPDEFGNPTPCRFCKSIYYWVDRCPDAPADIKKSGRGARNPRIYTTHPRIQRAWLQAWGTWWLSDSVPFLTRPRVRRCGGCNAPRRRWRRIREAIRWNHRMWYRGLWVYYNCVWWFMAQHLPRFFKSERSQVRVNRIC